MLNLSNKQPAVILLFLLLMVLFVAAAGAQGEPVPFIPTPTAADPIRPPLPDDIMPAVPDLAHLDSTTVAAEDYVVQPILFVPADLEPHPYGQMLIDRQIQDIQHWYAEQLRGKTFTALPAEVIIGQMARVDYFGSCYPPVNPSTCSWGYASWDRIYQELESRGYNLTENLVQGVYFQGEGMSTALGGGRRFLVGFSPDSLFPDCHEPGCAFNVSLGGLSHELGHALGLGWHPYGSDEAYRSVMSSGFYSYPHATFINTSEYPERDILFNSPFINTTLPLANPGFEACLDQWTVTSGSPVCPLDSGRSGVYGLELKGAQTHRLYQSFTVDTTSPYDISGWLSTGYVPADGRITVKLKSFSASGSLLKATTLLTLAQSNSSWTRFGHSLTFPAGAVTAQIVIITAGSGLEGYADDFHVARSASPPATPLIMSAYDGDATPTNRPLLSWSPLFSATSFDVQVATDPAFQTIVAEGSTAGFSYQVPVNLAYNSYAFWRVRARNGAGPGAWSPAWSVIPRQPADFYNDEFESAALDSAWSIVRENASTWHLSGIPGRRWEGYLTIDMQSGDLEPNDNARNIITRAMPNGDFTVETQANFFVGLNANYQQGGLIVYLNDNNYMKLAHVWRNGWTVELEMEKNGAIKQQASVYIVDETRLKIERRGKDYTAFYSTDGVSWHQLGETKYADWSNVRAGLTAYSILSTTNTPTAAFNWLRVGEPCPVLETAVTPAAAGTINFEGASCGHPGQFRPESPVMVTAVPAAGFAFDHWSGDVSGSANPLTVSAASKNIVANFIPVAIENIYVSPNRDSSISGIAYTRGDILKVDENGTWSLLFDASDLGIPTTTDLHAFTFMDDGSLLMAFDQSVTLPGLASPATPWDIVRFRPTRVGATTAGTFDVCPLDGNGQLSTWGEKIDALHYANNTLYLSTTGNYSISQGSFSLAGADEDILEFTPTGQLCDGPGGNWDVFLLNRTAQISGLAVEDIQGLWLNVDSQPFVSLLDSFTIMGVSGNQKDILHLLREDYSTYSDAILHWVGPDNGYMAAVDGLHIGSLPAPPPPANDDFDNATAITALPFTTVQGTQTATISADDPALPCGPSATGDYSVWYQYTPQTDQEVTISTVGSDYDTVLALWQGTRGSLTNIGCNDDSSTLQAQLEGVSLTAGETVIIEIASYSADAVGTLKLSVTGSWNPVYYVSPNKASSVGDVAYAPADILGVDENDNWRMIFDASDLGIPVGTDLHAFTGYDAFLMVFDRNTSLPGLTSVATPWDIIKFVPDQLGENTSGSFELYLDGSDIGLGAASEKIDALDWGWGGETLYLSTVGAFAAYQDGTKIRAADEDILAFTPSQTGANSAGYWLLWWDGSAEVPGVEVEDLSALDLYYSNGVNSDANYDFLASFSSAFTLDGVTGNQKDIVNITDDPNAPDPVWRQWIGPDHGYTAAVDGLSYVGAILHD